VFDINDLYQNQIQAALSYLQDKLDGKPDIGIILGSGLGTISDSVSQANHIPYQAIPHFPVSTAPGHKGELITGKIGKKRVMLMNGRMHSYEGFTMKEIVFPIRVMQLAGIQYLFITNAAGGLNPDYEPGTPMLITDHINMLGDNPLVGANVDSWGPRFPDMSEVYDRSLAKLAIDSARRLGIKLNEGVYIAVAGPNFETPAELKMLRRMGADAVGMSTIPEVISAVHGGIRVLGISAITDRAVGEDLEPLTAEQVLEIAEKTGSKIASIFLDLCERL
jgi:purine-nucleoside phosphorylase